MSIDRGRLLLPIIILTALTGCASAPEAGPQSTPTFTTTEAAFKSATQACFTWRQFWKSHGIDTVPGADRMRQNAGRLETWQKEFESWAARARGVDPALEQGFTRVAVTAPLAASSMRAAAASGSKEDLDAMIINMEDLTSAIRTVNGSCGG
jgi:hypothetical protein